MEEEEKKMIGEEIDNKENNKGKENDMKEEKYEASC
jgi:hypothetical protein